MLLYGTAHLIGQCHAAEAGDVTGWIDHEQCPADHKHEQGNGRLVDLRHALEGDEKVAHAKHDDNRNS